MLFFCKWEDRTSLVVDGASESDAKKIAAEVADGAPPARVIPLAARAFVAEVFIATEEDEGYEAGTLIVEPLPHVEDMLAALDDAELDAGLAPVPEPRNECGSEADGDDNVTYRCTKPLVHDGEHEARDVRGVVLATW